MGKFFDKESSNTRWLIGLALTGVVVLLGFFVWPTPFRYDQMLVDGQQASVRINRLDGGVEALSMLGWVRLAGEEKKDQAEIKVSERKIAFYGYDGEIYDIPLSEVRDFLSDMSGKEYVVSRDPLPKVGSSKVDTTITRWTLSSGKVFVIPSCQAVWFGDACTQMGYKIKLAPRVTATVENWEKIQ